MIIKLVLFGIWFIGFRLCQFQTGNRIGNSVARVMWPLAICYGARRWWHGKAKMYLFLDRTK